MEKLQDDIRVLVVDDHFYIRYGIVTALQLEPGIQVVGQAWSGEQAVQEFLHCSPDVTVLDGSLPDLHGTEVAQRIRRQQPAARLVLFSVEERAEDIYRAVQAGVQGYVPKSAAPSVLVQAIRHVAEGHTFFPAEISERLRQRNSHVSLSERELEVLQLLASGLPKKLIADRLHVSSETVKTYVSRILEKLDVHDRVQAVMVAVERGLIRLGH